MASAAAGGAAFVVLSDEEETEVELEAELDGLDDIFDEMDLQRR